MALQPLSTYPSTQYSFVDNLGIYSKNTLPHMYAQTLEAISDWSSTGGRSIVGVMREQRNQARLTEMGVTLDNNISDNVDQSINNTIIKSLIANGNLDGIDTRFINGITITNPDQTANLQVIVTTGNTTTTITTDPVGRYDPATDTYIVDNPGYDPSIDPTVNVTTPPSTPNDGTVNSGTGAGGGVSPTNPGSSGGGGTGSTPPTVLDKGEPKVPGSGSGSPYIDPLPPALDTSITSGTLTPSTYTVKEAIEEVITCNCDCWEQ